MGLAHLDIKLGNIFIKGKDSLVADFGSMKKIVFEGNVATKKTNYEFSYDYVSP